MVVDGWRMSPSCLLVDGWAVVEGWRMSPFHFMHHHCPFVPPPREFVRAPFCFFPQKKMKEHLVQGLVGGGWVVVDEQLAVDEQVLLDGWVVADG